MTNDLGDPRTPAVTSDHSKRESEHYLWQIVARLDPSYFSLVMATGIVSNAAWFFEMRKIAIGLLVFNGLAFVVLILLNLARLCFFPGRMLADLTDHSRGFSFFTIVAASCVLGSQFHFMVPIPTLIWSLWAFGAVMWLGLTYTIFTNLVVKEDKPSLAQGLHGGWLLAVVATQAVSLLGTLQSSDFETYRDPVLFFSLATWLGGGMLYSWIISLIFYRYAFRPMSVSELAPPYWINMGAMAISTLAGATLVSVRGDSQLLDQFLPFIKGTTLLFWATATWWIPLLITLGLWRHLYKRARLVYEVRYWALVFPLGMYSVGTLRMIEVLEVPFLRPVAGVFVYLALGTWLLTVIGMFRSWFNHSAA